MEKLHLTWPRTFPPDSQYQNHRRKLTKTRRRSSSSSLLRCRKSAGSRTTFAYPVAASSLAAMGTCFGRCATSKESPPHGAVNGAASFSPSCLWRRATDEQDNAELISNASEHSAAKKENLIFRIIKFKRKQKHTIFIDRFWERQDKSYVKIINANGTESITEIPLQNLDVNNLVTSSNFTKESVLNYTSHNNNTSNASSSLDLEWEHEYLRHFSSQSHSQPQSHQQQQQQQNKYPTQHSISHDNHDDEPTNINDDSWQYLSQPNNDDDQLNSLASTYSLPPAHTTTNDRFERRLTRAQTKVTKQNGGGWGGGLSSHNNSWSHISTPESLEWDIDEDQQRQLRVEDDNLGYETLELLHQIEQLKNQVLHETGDGLYESNDIELSAIAAEHGPETTNIS